MLLNYPALCCNNNNNNNIDKKKQIAIWNSKPIIINHRIITLSINHNLIKDFIEINYCLMPLDSEYSGYWESGKYLCITVYTLLEESRRHVEKSCTELFKKYSRQDQWPTSSYYTSNITDIRVYIYASWSRAYRHCSVTHTELI